MRRAAIAPAMCLGMLVAACSTAATSPVVQPGNRSPDAMITITEADDDSTITVQAGSPVTVRLAESATTGYRWAIDGPADGKAAVQPKPSDYPAGTIGVAGSALFAIDAREAGTARIAFKYWRQWEGDASVIQRFHVTLNITP